MSKGKSNATSFKPGRKKTGGRKTGIPNKQTRLLKDAILMAGEAVGNKKGRDGLVSYLAWAATKQAASYMALLGRLLPQQLEAKQTSNTEITYRTVAEIREELIRRGTPLDMILSELQKLVDKTGEDQ